MRRGSSIVRIVGPGSSDNAATTACAFGLMPRWTAFQDSISSPSTTRPFSTCGARPRSASRNPGGRRRRQLPRELAAPARRLHDCAHQRARVRAGCRRRGGAAPRRRLGAYRRGDEDVPEPGCRAWPACGPRSRRGAGVRGGIRRAAEALHQPDPRPRAPRPSHRGRLRVHRPDVRDRPRAQSSRRRGRSRSSCSRRRVAAEP